MQTFGGYVGGSLAPVFTGLVVQHTGSFVPAFLMGAGMALLAGLAYLLLIGGPIVTSPDSDVVAVSATTP